MSEPTSVLPSIGEGTRVFHIPYKFRQGLKNDLRLDRTKERVVFCLKCNTVRIVAKDPSNRANVVEKCDYCSREPSTVMVVHCQAFSANDKDALKAQTDEFLQTYEAAS